MNKNKKILLKPFNDKKKYNDEIFKFLKYPDIEPFKYVISSYGRIFNTSSMKELKYGYDKDGYIFVSVIKHPKHKSPYHTTIRLHRCVGFTFIKNDDPQVRTIINHKDGNKQNNYYKNLEWCTPKENTQHAINMGLQINSGPHCPSSVYDEKDVRKICKMLEDGYDVMQIYTYFTGDKKINDRPFYQLIFTIKNKTRHVYISKEYNIPDFVESSSKKKFTKNEELQIEDLIKKGYRPIDIVHFFGEKNSKTKGGRRIMDKIRQIRKYKNFQE